MRRVVGILAVVTVIALLEWLLRHREGIENARREVEWREIRERNPWIRR